MTKTIFIIILAVLFIIFSPLATIWALNTLFHLNIPMTIWTWLSMLILIGSVKASIK